jgi:tetratricopeptide (TPR) repeat protein
MKRIFLSIFGMVLVMPMLMAQGGLTSQATLSTYATATDLFQKDKYAVAQQYFDRYAACADADADRLADAVYYAAVCSERLQNNDAEYRIKEFMRRFPESGHLNMAWVSLGNYYFEKGNYGDALRSYLQVEPTEVEYNHRSAYQFHTGFCHFMQGDQEKAKSCFSHVDPKTLYATGATYYLGHIHYTNKQYEAAEKEFNKINLKKNKGLEEPVETYRFFICYHQGRDDEALVKGNRLLEKNNLTMRDEVMRVMGNIYFNRGAYEQALDHYRSANEVTIGKGGKVQQSWNYPLGYCYYMLGRYDSAAVYLGTFMGGNDSTAQNALFTLGDTYIKMDRKSDARTCFKAASEMKFNPAIQEEAAFNYAKLNCELNPNAYNESIRSFENYLKRYPKTQRKQEVQQILTSLYCTTRNYKDAQSLIERNKKELLKDATMRQAYQRILVNRGIELFNERNLQQAAVCFDSAVAINATPAITTDALYLSAESQYRLANYGKAQKLLDRFFTATSRKESVYYPQALYTAGYVYMRRKLYGDAEERFGEFLKLANDNNSERKQRLDSYNRMGDCLYVRKNFDGAIGYYDRVINAGGQDADYAMYQKALSYGAQGKNTEKLNCLNYIFEKYSNSPLSSKAMFEIANTYLICDNNEMALLYYNNFIKKYSQSSFVPQALLNVGLIYYNTEQNDKALETFDKLMTRYQGTDEARDALLTIKNIYVEQDRVEDYFSYVSKTTKTTVSAVEQDSTLYLAAENRYFAGNYDNAIAGFSNYIERFPHGLFILKAHYYLADALTRTNHSDKALSHYEWVAERGNNPYTESSLAQAAATHYRQKNYTKALDYYVPLVAVATSDPLRLEARMGIVRCWNAVGDSAHLRVSVQQLLDEPKATTEMRDESNVMLARSYYYADALSQAFEAYSPLLGSANGDYMGEAAFRRAEIRYRQNDLDGSEKLIEELVEHPGSDYWLAKTFILWADIFNKRGNVVQARQTLQSIIDNYEVVTDADEEVVMETRQHLRLLEAANSTSNDSQDDTPVVGPTIDLEDN